MGDKDPGRRSGKKADASTEIAQLMQQLKAKDEQIVALQAQVDELAAQLRKEREEKTAKTTRKAIVIGQQKEAQASPELERAQSPPPVPPKIPHEGSAGSLTKEQPPPPVPQSADLRGSQSEIRPGEPRSHKKATFAKDEKLGASLSTDALSRGSIDRGVEKRPSGPPKAAEIETGLRGGISGFFKRSKSTSVHMSLSSNFTSSLPPQFGSPLPDRDLSPLIRSTLSYLSNINKLDLLTGEIGAEQVTSLKVMYETGQVAQMGGWEALNEPRLVAGLIHHYFVQLPEPCVPRSLQGAIFGCASCTNAAVRASAFHTLIYRMPPSNRLLFITTLLHLDQILLSKERTPSMKDLVARSPRAPPSLSIPTPRTMAQLSARSELQRMRELAQAVANVWGPLFCQPDNNAQLEASIRFIEKLMLDWPYFARIEELMQYEEDEGTFKLGAVDCIINKLADVPPRRAHPGMDADMIISTHRYFLPTPELARRLSEMWSRLDGTDPWQRELQERVVQLFLLMLTTHATTITEDMRLHFSHVMNPFIKSLSTGPFMQEAEKMKRALKAIQEIPAIPKREAPKRHVILKLTDLNPEIVSAQLSIIDSEHLLALPESELLQGNFKHKERSPHYTLMMERFNMVSQWVASEIVCVTDLHDRASVLAVFVNIAKHCATFGNYHSSYAVYAGLNLPPVTRMKETWARLPKKAVDRFEKLQRLFNTKKNYLNYRKELAERADAVVPILSLYPKFYTSIEENHASIVESPLYPDVELVNLAKLRMLWKVTSELKDFQARWTVSDKHGAFMSFMPKEGPSQSTAITTQDVKDYLGGALPVRSEDEQFSLSLQVEPRKAERTE